MSTKRRVPTGLALLVLIASTGIAAATPAPAGQASAAAARLDVPQPLQVGQRFERELRPGEVHSWVLDLAAGQFATLVIDQASADLAITVRTPDGAVEAEVDGRFLGPEPVSVTAGDAGRYRFDIRSADAMRLTRRYVVALETRRPRQPDDERELQAERAGTHAKQLLSQATTLEARQQAASAWDEALTRWRALSDRFGEAQALNALGFIRNAVGDNRGAMIRYEEALAIRRALGDRMGEAETLNNLAAAYSGLGDKPAAATLYEQVLSLRTTLHDVVGQATALNNLGSIYFALGELRLALDRTNRAVELWNDVQQPVGQALALNAVASVAAAMGDSDRAIDGYSRLVTSARELHDRRLEAVALANLAALYISLGEYARALPIADQALSMFQAAGDRVSATQALLTVAKCHAGLGDSARSLDAYERVAAMALDSGDQRARGLALNAIGLARFTADQPDADSRYTEALALLRSAGDRRAEAGVLLNIGQLDHARGNEAAAREHDDAALTIFRTLRDLAGQVKALLGLARVDRDAGQLTDARTRIAAALDLIESQRSSVTDPDLRASLVAANRTAYEFNIDLLMQFHRLHPDDGFHRLALEASERARARSLLDVLTDARADIRRGGDAGLLERARALRDQINAVAVQQSRLPAGAAAADQASRLQGALDGLIAEEQRILAQIRAASPRYATLMQPDAFAASEAQRLLDSGTVLLEFALGSERSVAWVVTSDAVFAFDLPAAAEIDRAGRHVRDLLTTSGRIPGIDREYLGAADRLSALVLAPVANLIEGKRLLIVADGILQYLPFAALPFPGDAPATPGSLLVAHTRDIVMLPSASVLAAIRRDAAGRPRPPRSIAVLADPVFGADDARVRGAALQRQPGLAATGSRPAGATESRQVSAAPTLLRSARDTNLTVGDGSFPRLRATRREAADILRLGTGGVFAALDFDATRDAAMGDGLKQYRIVHIATHGLLNGVHPELSGLVFSLVDPQGHPQDGFLRLHDIYNLDLPVDLVVLSACQTGLGPDVTGEGVVGLTRGFLYAGASRVVVSLWKVDDDATAALMQRFYRGILGSQHLTPAAALRAAQLDMAATPRWRSPYFWAGFVLYGEAR